MDINFKELERFAARIRVETLKEFKEFGSGHVGGSMSTVETLAVLYGAVLNIDPKNPKWPNRDYLVISKGHSGPSLYATLALKGYFPLEMLMTLNKPGTDLPSHCDMNLTPGVDMTTGSLGQGISTAIGLALGNRLDNRDNKVYFILGDGECDEGQIWEGALFASHWKLDNLIGMVDYNKQQLDGYTKDVLNLGDLRAKFETFGWYAQSVDGHNVEEIYNAMQKAKETKGKPSMIVLNTVKGKGCVFAEGQIFNHHMSFSKKQCIDAITCAEKKLNNLEKEVRL